MKYIIPEDGDSAEHPNAFRLRVQSDVLTLHSLRQQFPVPGQYQFRFLTNFGGMNVWRDLTDDSDCIPTQNGSIYIKANRIASLEGIQQMKNDARNHSAEAASTRPRPEMPAKPVSVRLLSFEESPRAAETDLLGMNAPLPSKVPPPPFIQIFFIHLIITAVGSIVILS